MGRLTSGKQRKHLKCSYGIASLATRTPLAEDQATHFRARQFTPHNVVLAIMAGVAARSTGWGLIR
jgi:hypothetical protein